MTNRLWLYRAHQNDDPGEFILLVNARASSSRRNYDALTGELLSDGLGRGLPYEEAFGYLIRSCVRIEGVPAKLSDLGRHLDQATVNNLRKQVNLPPVGDGQAMRYVRAGRMLGGFDQIVSEALGLGQLSYVPKTAARRLSENPPSLDGPSLIQRLYDRIDKNWDGSECRSKEIWRWRSMPDISAQNSSVEKTLEKAVVRTTHTWVNQIPAASGLLRTNDDTHCSVDLGHQLAPGEYELIELKAGPNADTPLRAAFEIIGYGLLYCFARIHIREVALASRSQLLSATAIHMKVLGPRDIYRDYCFDWLESELDRGLQVFAQIRFLTELAMRFSFEAFPPDFRWPGSTDEQLRSAIDNRSHYNFERSARLPVVVFESSDN